MDINVLVSGSLILAIGPSGFSAASGQAVANLGAIAIPNDPNLVLDYQYNPAANTISLRTVPLTQQQYQDAVFYSSATLSAAQGYACAELLTNMNTFIAVEPNGTPRYDQDFMFLALNFEIQKGMTTAPIPAFQAWETALQSAYQAQVMAIMECATVAAVQAIDTSVNYFETRYGVSGTVSADPNITVAQLA